MTIGLAQPAGTAERGRVLRRHLRETLALALPIAVARIGVILMFVVDSVMTGWSGKAELAALGLGTGVVMALVLVALGALQAIAVIAARSAGQGDRARIGATFRAGLLVAGILGALIVVATLFAEPFFLATGQDPALAAAAGRITVLFGVGVPAILFFSAATYLLEATGAPRTGVWIMTGANLLNVALNTLMIFGVSDVIPPMGAAGAVIASNIVRWLAFGTALIVLWRRERDPATAIGAFRAGGALGMVSTLLALGVPMGLAQGLESTGFAAVTVISGRIGVDAAAVHQAMMTVMSFVYMFSVGVAGAVAIRVGQAAGAGDREALRPAGVAGLVVSLAWTLAFSLVLVLLPERASRLFGLDGSALALGVATVPIVAAVLPFDGMMAALIGALRGLADVWAPTLIQGGAFWLLAVPLALFLAPWLNAPGLIAAILAGVVASFVLMAARFARKSA